MIVFMLGKLICNLHNKPNFQQILFINNDKRGWKKGTGVSSKFMQRISNQDTV